jgi:hypothetical protein
MVLRISILVASAVATLAAGVTAFAATAGSDTPAAASGYEPQLNVSSPGTTSAGYAINAQLTSSTTTETGRLSIYSPPLFQVAFPEDGAEAGSASVRLQLADRNNQYVNLTGTVVVASGETLTCAMPNSPTPVATLAVKVSGGGLTLSIPMAAYKITGSDAQYSAYELTECLPPPGVPQGTAGRAPEGGRLVGETLTMPALKGPAKATSTWASGWTPFTSGTATLDDSGSVAAQAVSGAPGFILHAKTTVKTSTKNGKQVKKTYVTLTGRVTRGALGSVKADVNVYYGTKPNNLVSTRWQSTDAYGEFSYETQVTPPYRYFQAFARLPGRSYPSRLCQPMILTYPCVDISTTSDRAVSNEVRVRASS